MVSALYVKFGTGQFLNPSGIQCWNSPREKAIVKNSQRINSILAILFIEIWGWPKTILAQSSSFGLAWIYIIVTLHYIFLRIPYKKYIWSQEGKNSLIKLPIQSLGLNTIYLLTMNICLRTIYFNQLSSGSSIITISTIRIVYSATHWQEKIDCLKILDALHLKVVLK